MTDDIFKAKEQNTEQNTSREMLCERINILLILTGRDSFVTAAVGEVEIVLLPPLGSFQPQTFSSELHQHPKPDPTQVTKTERARNHSQVLEAPLHGKSENTSTY